MVILRQWYVIFSVSWLKTMVCHLLGQLALQIKLYFLPQHLVSVIGVTVVQ